MDRYDVIVIGAGIAGLIAARDAARRGAKVKLIEASGRVGGQIWSIKHDGSAQTIALGAEWLHSEKHEALFKEMSDYGISLDRFKHKREYCLYGGKGDKAKVDELPLLVNQIKTDPLFVSALAAINWDVSFITLCKGYDQPDSEQFDMPFHEYVITRLKIPETSFVYEYIIMQTFYFTGGNPLTQSALGVLYVIAGFRTAEKAYGLEGPLLRRYPASLGRLVEKLAEEIKELGVTIDLNMPVVSVRKEEIFLPPNRVANYDYPALPDRERIVHVKCTSKASFCTRSVIVCVPMKCLTSILFYPSLPLAVTKAAERCNAGAEQIKMYAFAAGISSDIARLVTAQYECRETYTIARHHKHNPNALSAFNNSAANAAAVLAASSVSAKSAQGRAARRTLTASYSRNATGNSDEYMYNHTLICTNGSREDLLKNIARNLRKIHPVIELPNDSNYVTPGASRPSTSASTSLDARRPSTPLIDHREGAVRSIMTPHELQQITAINTSAYTVSHDNSIIYHDFLSDVCCRGTWFNLRSGTAYLHVLAIKAAQMPWDKSNNIHIEGATDSSQSPRAAAPQLGTNQQCTDDLSLIIAGGELHPEWMGWVEGAVRSGAAAAKRVIPYLFPPMVERNFMKRAAHSEGEQMLIGQSPMKGSIHNIGTIVLPALSRSLVERRSNIS